MSFSYFGGIKTLADFKAAFDRAFSRVPLQDEFPEWPAEVRQAIAEHRLSDGMTKRQAYCVVGNPTEFRRVRAGRQEGRGLAAQHDPGAAVCLPVPKPPYAGHPPLRGRQAGGRGGAEEGGRGEAGLGEKRAAAPEGGVAACL